MKTREIDRRITVDVECCNHCHGEPEYCPGDSWDSQPVIDPRDWDRALILLEDAHSQIRSPQTLTDWRALALRDDIRWFLRKCGVEVIR